MLDPKHLSLAINRTQKYMGVVISLTQGSMGLANILGFNRQQYLLKHGSDYTVDLKYLVLALR